MCANPIIILIPSAAQIQIGFYALRWFSAKWCLCPHGASVTTTRLQDRRVQGLGTCKCNCGTTYQLDIQVLGVCKLYNLPSAEPTQSCPDKPESDGFWQYTGRGGPGRNCMYFDRIIQILQNFKTLTFYVNLIVYSVSSVLHRSQWCILTVASVTHSLTSVSLMSLMLWDPAPSCAFPQTPQVLWVNGTLDGEDRTSGLSYSF